MCIRDRPTTSQLTPYDYEEACQAALKNSDEVLIITLSGLLSGTAQSAVSAARKFPGKVWVVDSENVTIGAVSYTHLDVYKRQPSCPRPS